jgi:hypothetical protein
MTFENDFPSIMKSLKDNGDTRGIESDISFGIGYFQVFCLDKQKVRDALGRLENNLGRQFDKTGTYSPYVLMNELKKELGL